MAGDHTPYEKYNEFDTQGFFVIIQHGVLYTNTPKIIVITILTNKHWQCCYRPLLDAAVYFSHFTFHMLSKWQRNEGEITLWELVAKYSSYFLDLSAKINTFNYLMSVVTVFNALNRNKQEASRCKINTHVMRRVCTQNSRFMPEL